MRFGKLPLGISGKQVAIVEQLSNYTAHEAEAAKIEAMTAMEPKAPVLLNQVMELVADRSSLWDVIADQLVCLSCGTLSSACHTTCRGINLCGSCYDHCRDDIAYAQWFSPLDPLKASDCSVNVCLKHVLEEGNPVAYALLSHVREGDALVRNKQQHAEAGANGERGDLLRQALEKYKGAWELCCSGESAGSANGEESNSKGEEDDAGAGDEGEGRKRLKGEPDEDDVMSADESQSVNNEKTSTDAIGDDIRSMVCARLAQVEQELGMHQESFEHAVLSLALFPDAPSAAAAGEMRSVIECCGTSAGSSPDAWGLMAADWVKSLPPPRVRGVLPERLAAVQEACECPCCFNLLYEPVTLPTGHTLCKTCVRRCLEVTHPGTGTATRPVCPYTRQPLDQFMAWINQDPSHLSVNRGLEAFLKATFADEYALRKAHTEQELKESMSEEGWVPIFVCMVAWPGVPCPLHVFEPRYRLMMRRSHESGFQKFGMCSYVADESTPYSDVGTMLVMRDLKTLPDGRMLVDCVGYRRFRVVERSMRDGYNVAKIQYFLDTDDPGLPIDADNTDMLQRRERITTLSTRLRERLTEWLERRGNRTRERIVEAFGEIPEDPVLLSFWLCALVFQYDEVGRLMLSSESLLGRLTTVNNFAGVLFS